MDHFSILPSVPNIVISCWIYQYFIVYTTVTINCSQLNCVVYYDYFPFLYNILFSPRKLFFLTCFFFCVHIALARWFSTGGHFSLEEVVAELEVGAKGVLLTSGRWKSGILPNILHCIGQPPTTKNASSATVEKQWFSSNCQVCKYPSMFKPTV